MSVFKEIFKHVVNQAIGTSAPEHQTHDSRTLSKGYDRAVDVVNRVNNINPECYWVVFWTVKDEDEPRYEMDDGMTDRYELVDNEDEARDRYEGLLVSELEEIECAGYAPVKGGSEPHWVG